MNEDIINDIFPPSVTISPVPCGRDGCVFPLITRIILSGGAIDPTAANTALQSLSTDVTNSLSAVQATTIATVENSMIILAINIYVPIFLILIIIIWILYAVGIIGGLTAIVITILLIVVAVVFIFLLRASVSAYLNQQLTVITAAISDYIMSNNFLSALNSAACVYLANLPPVTSVDTPNTNTNTSNTNTNTNTLNINTNTSNTNTSNTKNTINEDIGDIQSSPSIFY